eukprot:422698_1
MHPSKLWLFHSLWYIALCCDESFFTTTITQRLTGLQQQNDINSAEDCVQACCDETQFYCTVYQWCSNNPDDTCLPKSSCWIGNNIIEGTLQTGWISKARADIPTNCQWNIKGYGIVDLSPLADFKIEQVREGYQQYSLLYTPCQNSIICDRNQAQQPGMALQVMTNNLPDIECNSILAKWDNGTTTPVYETTSDGKDQIVFNYPVVENIFSGGCENGRTAQIKFVCNETADPYDRDTVSFYQQQKNTDNICPYNISIDTMYACNNTVKQCQWMSNDGKHILNLMDIMGMSLVSKDTENDDLSYVYTPCSNSHLCDDTYSMAYLMNSTNFQCEKYLAVWDDGINVPQFNEQLKSWQFVYENGEPCNGFKDVFVLIWNCDSNAKIPVIVEAVKDTECLYQMIINSTLACG